MRGFMEAVDGFNRNPCLYLKATLEAKEAVAERWPGLCVTLLKNTQETHQLGLHVDPSKS